MRATRPVDRAGDLRGRRIAAARAAAIGIWVVGRREGVRFALAVIGLLVIRLTWGVGGDGRRGDESSQLADRFAPPIGHLSSSDD